MENRTDRPRSTRWCTARCGLGCGARPTRDALLPRSSAEAQPHGHRTRSAAAASNVGYAAFGSRGVGPRAHRPVENRPTAHGARTLHCAVRTWLCVRDNSRRAPPQLVGRGSAARPPHQVGGCGFASSVLPRSIPAARGPRAHRPVENRPTAHGARTRALRGADLVVVRANSRRAPPQSVGRGSAARPPHQVGGCGFGPSAMPRTIPGARPARSSPRGESADRPRSTSACTARCGLGCGAGPTRDALLPSSMAEARPHGHRIRSAAAASDRRCYRARLPRRAARALIAPWRIGRPPTEHARCTARCGLGCGAGRLATRSSPFVGRGSAARPPHQVGGCGFELSALPRSSPCGARPARSSPRGELGRPPTEHARALRGADLVVVWANSRRAPPQLVGRGSAARPPHQVGGCGFEPSVVPRLTPLARGPRAHRPVENRTTAHGARTQHCAVRTWLWCGPTRDALLPSSLAEALPHGHRIRSAAAASDRRCYRARSPVARGPRAHRPVENRTTAHGARARTARCGLGCVCGPTRDALLPVRWPRLSRTATASGQRLRLRTSVTALDSRGARPARSSPRGESDDRPRSTRAHCAVRTWLWCGPTRDALLPSSLAEAPPHGHRIGRRLRLRTVGVTALDLPWRAARALIAPWRIGRPPTEHARALRGADLVVCAGQLATRSSPVRWPRLCRTATASGRRLRLRTVGVPFDSRGARPARSSPRGESDDRPRSKRAHCAVRTWLWCGPTRDALLPSSLAEAQPHGHRIRSAAAASDRRRYRVRSRGARPARSSPRGELDDRPRSTRVHCAVRTWLWCGATRDALLPSSLAEAQPHGHRIRSAAAASYRQCSALDSRGARPARSSPRRGSDDRPRSTRVHCAVWTCFCGRANSRRAPAQVLGRGSAARPPHRSAAAASYRRHCRA